MPEQTNDFVEAANPDEVVIPRAEYERLKESDQILAALHAGGVDNWDWYEESLADLD